LSVILLSKAFPETQEVFDITTGILASFSMDISVMKTCINGHYCSQNNQIRKFVPFVKLPEEQHVLDLSFLFVAS
jgi:hypothetical protein